MADKAPEMGTPLTFTFRLVPDEQSNPVQIEGKGRVVRVERGPSEDFRSGFAVMNLSFELREVQDTSNPDVTKVRRGARA